MESVDRRIAFAEPLHTTGERVQVASFSQRQALAWWIAAELIRRHPDELRVTEEHVHQYGPAVTLMRRDPSPPNGWAMAVFLSQCVFCHVTPSSWFGGDEERFNWLEVLLTEDRRGYVIEQLERAEGLSSPSTTPPTQASSVGPRVIAAFLARTMLAPTKWRLTNGYQSDDDWAGPNEDLFTAMPAVDQDRARHTTDEQRDGPVEQRYWFVCRVGKDDALSPVAAIDVVTGRAWTGDRTVDLMSRYKALGRKIDALTSDVLPPTH